MSLLNAIALLGCVSVVIVGVLRLCRFAPGVFSRAISARAATRAWCGVAGAAVLACLHGWLAQDQPRAWMGVVLGALLPGTCVGIVRVGKSAAAGEIAWMTAVLREALA